jgi:hypothetical protein
LSAERALGTSFDRVAKEGAAEGLRVVSGMDQDGLRSVASRVSPGDARKEETALVDICVVEKETFAPDVSGIVLDYEVSDMRTAGEANAFLGELRELTNRYGKVLVVNTNPLPGNPAE